MENGQTPSTNSELDLCSSTRSALGKGVRLAAREIGTPRHSEMIARVQPTFRHPVVVELSGKLWTSRIALGRQIRLLETAWRMK